MTASVYSFRARARLVRAGILVAVISIALIAQLLLSIGLADGGYQIAQLKQEQKQVARDSQNLSEQISTLQSPQHLSERAQELGMEPSSQVTFLRLSDGQTLGSADSRGTQIAMQKGLVGNSLLAVLGTDENTASQTDVGKTPQRVDDADLQAGTAETDSATDADSDSSSSPGSDGAGTSLPQVTLR